MKKMRFFLALALMVPLWVVAIPEAAVAHGSCVAYIHGWVETGTNIYVKGQTRFYCTDFTLHNITLDVEFERCKLPPGSMDCYNWEIYSRQSRTCTSSYDCQKTITSPSCVGGWYYFVKGRWYATKSGTTTHKNSLYPAWNDQYPQPAGGNWVC